MSNAGHAPIDGGQISGRSLRLLNGFIVACTVVTGAAMFNGFRSLGTQTAVELVSAGLFTILVAGALTFCLHGLIATASRKERRAWAIGYAFLALISVLMSFGTYYSLLSSSDVASDSAQSALAQTIRPLSAFDLAYSELANSANDLQSYSKALALQESSQGGTCGSPKIAIDGPRARLRSADAATFAEFARHFQDRRTRVKALVEQVQSLSAHYDPAHHEQSVQEAAQAWDDAAALSVDPKLKAWEATLEARLRQGAGPILDAASGKTFTCPDAVLSAKLRAAAAVTLPVLPATAPAIQKPGLAANVTRGFDILLGRTQFDSKRDGLPLLLALAVDMILAIFVYAKHLRQNPSPEEAPEAGPATGPEALQEAISGEPTGPDLQERLDRSLGDAKAWALVRFLDSHSVTTGRKRYLVVPQAGSRKASRARNLAHVLVAISAAKLHHATTVARLNPRWREQLGSALDGESAVDVYLLRAGVIEEFVLDSIKRGDSPIGPAPGSAAQPEQPQKPAAANAEDPSADEPRRAGETAYGFAAPFRPRA